MSLERGDVVGGRYRIEERIGQGGMAVVYRAEHVGTGRPCAIKLMLDEVARQPKLVEQFLSEARIAGKIAAHPNVVDVFDVDVDREREAPYIAMELLSGKTLGRFVRDHAPLTVRRVCELLEQLADALGAAHAAGIVHRDLKPGNVFVALDHRAQLIVKVLDFGIAKVLAVDSAATSTRVGTPAYCAPEQLGASVRKLAAERGFTISRGVSPATDVWAFGLIALDLLTGLEPSEYWEAETLADMVVKVALEQRVSPRQQAGERGAKLPESFDAWFLRCMAHDAAERWPSVGDAFKELRSLLQEAGLLDEMAGQPPPPLPPAARPSRPSGPGVAALETLDPRLLRTIEPPTTPLDGPPSLPPESERAPTVAAWQQTGPARKRSRLWLLLAASAGLVAVVAIALLARGPADEPRAGPNAGAAAVSTGAATGAMAPATGAQAAAPRDGTPDASPAAAASSAAAPAAAVSATAGHQPPVAPPAAKGPAASTGARPKARPKAPRGKIFNEF
ncbi:MAG: serine/threonine protein kinase [Deltaproteobacteria bacterium]|nr:serine/threonine protein kinase [Deltaproteobacteria bacterium]